MDTAEKILETALGQFSSLGFHGASTAHIAKKAGVSNGSLFHYFESKEKLIHELQLHIRKKQFEFITEGLAKEKHSREKIRLLWTRTIDWAIANSQAYLFLRMYQYSPYNVQGNGAADDYKKVFLEVAGQGISLKQIRYMPEDLVYEMTKNNTYGMAEYLALNPLRYRMPEFMRQAFERFWDSIKA